MKKFLFLAVTLFAINQSQSFASGYSTNITSTSGLANSYAGSASGIHDISDMFYNPAIIADVKTNQFIASITQLNINIKASSASASLAGNSVAGNNGGGDVGQNAQIPAFYLASPLSKNIVFGLSVTTPFGLATKYDQNWVGRYNAIESSIVTTNINPSISYKINDDFSIAAGFQAQRIQSTLSKAVYSAAGDALGKLSGSDWGYGYNFGAKYKLNNYLQFGLGYRSKIDYKITGQTQISYPYNLVSTFNAKTTTPESLTFGGALKLNNKVELASDVTWTRWSRLKSLVINAQNSLLNDRTDFNWHDSFLYSLGANFSINEKSLIRTGIAYEKNSISNSSREPRVPAGDIIWTSVGFSYKINKTFSIDATYLHQFFKNLTANVGSVAGSGVQANYKARADIFSLGMKKEF